MKKICFVTTISLTLRMFVLKTAEYIHENTDWDISFICSTDDEFADSLPDYIHYYPVPMERGISISGIKAMLEMKQIFSREKFDMIQFSTPNASLYASLAGKMARVPVRLYCQWGMAYVGFEGIKRIVFKIEEKLVCALSTCIEPDSHSNLDFGHRERLYPSDKGHVIWNGSACGVNLSKFDISKKEQYRSEVRHRLGLGSDDVVFGFVGRITKDKGINELYTAFKRISEQEDNCYLLMVGPNEADDSVQSSLVEWAKESDKVIFTGFTNVVEQYLSSMDIYILPSYREGFGMGVVEAEVMEVPVIVTDIPGPIDAMRHEETGLIVKKADVDSLYSSMKYLMENSSLIKQYGIQGRKFAVQNYNQDHLLEKILIDRKELLGEK